MILLRAYEDMSGPLWIRWCPISRKREWLNCVPMSGAQGSAEGTAPTPEFQDRAPLGVSNAVRGTNVPNSSVCLSFADMYKTPREHAHASAHVSALTSCQFAVRPGVFAFCCLVSLLLVLSHRLTAIKTMNSLTTWYPPPLPETQTGDRHKFHNLAQDLSQGQASLESPFVCMSA